MRRLAPLAFALLLAAAPAKKKAAPAPSAWTVQVASTSSRAEAERLVTVLVGRDAPAWWSETTVNGKTMYRVRVGHFHSKEEAKSFGDGLAAAWKLDFWVAPDDTPSAGATAAASAIVKATEAPTQAATPVATSTTTATPAATPVVVATTAPRSTATPAAAATTAIAAATPEELRESAGEILAEAQAAHGGASGGFSLLDRAASVTLRYRLKSLDPKTGEPVFTTQTWLRKGKDRLRLEIAPLEGSGPSSVTVYTPKSAWVDAGGVRTALTPPTARARIESLGPAGVLRLPLEFGQKGAAAAGIVTMTLAGTRTLNGDSVIRLDAAPPPPSYREASLYLEPASHRLTAARFLTDAGELLLTFSDYHALTPGLLVPWHRSVYRDGAVVSTLEIDSLTLDGPIDDALFAK